MRRIDLRNGLVAIFKALKPETHKRVVGMPVAFAIVYKKDHFGTAKAP